MSTRIIGAERPAAGCGNEEIREVLAWSVPNDRSHPCPFPANTAISSHLIHDPTSMPCLALIHTTTTHRRHKKHRRGASPRAAAGCELLAGDGGRHTC